MVDEEKIRSFREQIRRLERWLEKTAVSGECCCGLSLAQCHTLIEAGGRGTLSLVELASTLGLDVSTMSRTVSGLVMIGMLTRSVNEKDRRYLSISLTEQGRKAYEKLDGALMTYYKGVLGSVPANKREEILESVTILADAVMKFRARNVCGAIGGGKCGPSLLNDGDTGGE